MAKLKYDTDTMRRTARRYKEKAVELQKVKDDLKKMISSLKEEDWKSDAGDAFMKMYILMRRECFIERDRLLLPVRWRKLS